ncbi:MAG: CHAT domain-containing protein [Pseudomonadota bacterium]
MALFWALPGAAFEYPRLAGANDAEYAAAASGDAYAAFSYVLPVLNKDALTEAEWADARGWLEWMYAEFKADGSVHGMAATATNLANRLVVRQDFDDAIQWIQVCADLEGAEEVAPRAYLGWCYNIGGTLHVQMALPEEALTWHSAALDIFTALYEETGEHAHLENALDTHGSRTYALTLMAAYDEAVEQRKEGLRLAIQHTGRDSIFTAAGMLNLATTLWYAGRYEEADIWFDAGMPLAETHFPRYSLLDAVSKMNNALLAYDLGQLERARTLAMSVVPYLAAYPELSLEQQRWTFQVLRKVAADQGDVDRAILFGKMAVNAQQEIRSRNAGFADAEVQALRDRWSGLYKELASLLIAEGRFSEAQAVLNMEKEQEAFDFLKRDAGAVLTETRAVLTDTERSEAKVIRDLAAKPVAAARLYDALLAEAGDAPTAEQDAQLFLLDEALVAAEDAFLASVDDFLAQVDVGDRKGFEAAFDATGTYQRILEQKERPTAILQLAVLEDALHLFLTLPGATVHETVPISRGDLRGQVFEALKAIERIDPEVEAHLQGLHAMLLAPVREALEVAGTEVIMLNAGDVLRYVPFAALHDGTGHAVRDFAFTQYVAAVPTDFAVPPRDRGNAAGFAVTRAHGNFSALPGAGFEIEALFAASDGEGVLDGHTGLDEGFDEAALRRVLRGSPGVLHIASHFALRPGQVDDSFLLLGDGSELPLSRFGSRRFNLKGVDLLTLSACQTAVGSGDGSEIDGIGVAALQKGASAVMASLWPVADAATPILMHDFYDGLYAQGLDKAEALRRAQIAMLDGGETATLLAMRAAEALEPQEAPPQGFAHPYFWSAFIIMGNWL